MFQAAARQLIGLAVMSASTVTVHTSAHWTIWLEWVRSHLEAG